MKIENKEKWLFNVDLDGTLLLDSKTSKISKENKQAIFDLIASGHIVCISTGRPWASSKNIYEDLKLDTIVSNYNGARIHNPQDYSFTPKISYLNLNDVLYILKDKKIKSAISNLAVEGPGWVNIEKRDKTLEEIFSLSAAKKFQVGIKWDSMPLKPTGIIFKAKIGTNKIELLNYLSRTYGDLASFSGWQWNEGPIFDITSIDVSKGKALSLIARYYHIPIERTVAIGDSENDLPMFNVAEISVGLNNANDNIKERVDYVTKKSNKESGFAEFVNDFLKTKDKKELKINPFKQKNFL